MITNCPQGGFGKAPAPLRGGGQSGGPMPDAMDVWRAGAPHIDLFAADIYSADFTGYCAKYNQSGNPLFIADTGRGPEIKARALYVFGRHDAMAFSPFGIDGMVGGAPDAVGYDVLAQLAPMILKHQGKGEMNAILLKPGDPLQKVRVGNYTIEVTPTKPRGAPATAPAQQTAASAALFIATGPDEYFMVGNGATITFSSNTPGTPLAGIGTVEEGTFVNGKWVPGRLLAGDDTEEGDYLFLRNNSILRVTVYRYR